MCVREWQLAVSLHRIFDAGRNLENTVLDLIAASYWPVGDAMLAAGSIVVLLLSAVSNWKAALAAD